MYKFSNKKNREDVVALRWPKACLACGVDVPGTCDSRRAVIGLFHVDKKTTRGDRQHTQVLVKLPGYFYICSDCTDLIERAAKSPPQGLEKIVETLRESPWMIFLEVEKTGHVRLPDGLFKEKLQKMNPDGWFKTKDDPMCVLKSALR